MTVGTNGAHGTRDRYEQWLAGASISPEVAALRPDYRVVLLVAEGLSGGPSNEASDQLLSMAQEQARDAIRDRAVEELPHIAAWRDAYRSFGAKPQRTRNSAEALLRRVTDGLPRIDRLTDAYNAISILVQTPLGGENVAAYNGPLHLVRAGGTEEFATMASGAEVIEHPDSGEVVWRDDAGVTCRRWNWRQCYRTRLTQTTRDAVFICDVLDSTEMSAAERAGKVLEALAGGLRAVSPQVSLTPRIIAATGE